MKQIFFRNNYLQCAGKFFLLLFLFQGIIFSESKAQAVLGVDTLINSGDQSNRINLVFLGDGYTSAQQTKFISDVNTIVNKLFSTEPFNHYINFFNVYAVKVVSVDSGADHPQTAGDCISFTPAVPTSSVNTMLGATFDYGGLHRLLYCTNTANINSILQYYTPFYDKALIVVNSPFYGGSGGTFPTCSTEPNSAEIMIHELGHSFAGLGDEYGGSSCGGAEKPNCTQETNPLLVKWKNWFPAAAAIPTPANTNCDSIGLYQGANYCNTNWYRPKCNCKMNQLGVPFCSVCTQELVYTINNTLNLIESFSPATSVVHFANGETKSFSIATLNPIPNSLNTTWKLDGQIISANTNSFDITATVFNSGLHTLIFTVSDASNLSRTQMPEYSTSWNLIIEGPTEVNNNNSQIPSAAIALSENEIVPDENVFSIYPNPTLDRFYLLTNFSSNKKINFILTDVFGKELLRNETNTQAVLREGIDLSDLSRGIYLLQINSGNISEVKRVIKQ